MSDQSMPGERGAGYREIPLGGARVRSDIVEVHVFRLPPGAPDTAEFLQLRRAAEPLAGTWQPVMGHMEPGESSPSAALRELTEETGMRAGDRAMLGFWALEQVHPFYVAAVDAVVLAPRFVVQADPAWEPALNDEHGAARWVTVLRAAPESSMDRFLWPGQKEAVREIVREIVRPNGPAREHLRLDPSRFAG